LVAIARASAACLRHAATWTGLKRPAPRRERPPPPRRVPSGSPCADVSTSTGRQSTRSLPCRKRQGTRLCLAERASWSWSPPQLPGQSTPHLLSDPGEQVVFQIVGVHSRRINYRPSQMIVLGRPRLPLQAHRAAEPASVRVDLGGVRDKRLIADLEVVTARHPRGDLEHLHRRIAWPVRPLGKTLSVGRLKAMLEHLLVQR